MVCSRVEVKLATAQRAERATVALNTGFFIDVVTRRIQLTQSQCSDEKCEIKL